MPIGIPPERDVGLYEAVARGLTGRYLPNLVGTLAGGMGRVADIASFPIQYAIDVDSEEARERWARSAMAGPHGIGAMYAHTGSALLDNIGGLTSSIGLGDPLEFAAKPLREFHADQTAKYEQDLEGAGVPQRVGAGVIQSIGALAEIIPTMMAMGSAAPLALPALMANRASRDAYTGEGTGITETAKGAAMGAAMHGIGKLSSTLSTVPRRAGMAGAGFGGITAVEGGSDQDVAAAFFTGAGLSALSPQYKPQAPKQQNFAENAVKWERDNQYQMDREYVAHGGWDSRGNAGAGDGSHSLVNGLRKAESRMKSETEFPENGVPRVTEEGAPPRAATATPTPVRVSPGRYEDGIYGFRKVEREGPRGGLISEWETFELGQERMGRLGTYKNIKDARQGLRTLHDGRRAEASGREPIDFTAKPMAERYDPKGPKLPDDGFPATAIPGQAATLWQQGRLEDAAARGANTNKWTEWLGRFNVDRMFAPGEQREVAIEILNQHGGAEAFYGVTKGSVPWIETIAAARPRVAALLGENPNEQSVFAFGRNKSQLLDPEQLAAIEMVAHMRFAKLDTASKRVYEGKENAHAEYAMAATELISSIQDVAGATSSAGRTLNILKSPTTAIKKAQAADILIKRWQGKGNIEELNRELAQLRDPGKVVSILKASQELADSGWGWKVSDAWTAGLLSSFATHMANAKGNTAFMSLYYGLETGAQVAIGAAKAPIQMGITRAAGEVAFQQKRNNFKNPSPLEGLMIEHQKPGFLAEHKTQLTKEHPGLDHTTRMHAQDAVGMMWALANSGRFAMEMAGKSFQSGKEFSPAEGIRGQSPFDGTRYGGPDSYIPFRALTGMDAGFKGAAYATELFGAGVAEARQLGVPYKKRFEYARQFAIEVGEPLPNTPPARLNFLRGTMINALERADTLTFTNELGRIGRSIQKVAKSHPVVTPIVPFWRTPMNVSKQGIYRSPLGVLAPKNVADIWAGGRRQDEALARLATGGVIGLAIYDSVMNGDITGATPTNEGDRELQRSMGIAPLSRKIKGEDGQTLMESYARLEPLATPVGMIATLIDAHSKGQLSTDDVQGAMELVSGTIAEIVVNRSTMQGPKRAMEAVTQPENRMGSYIDSLVSSVIPAMVNSIARGQDPYRRDQTGLPEAIWARLPGKAKTPELLKTLGFGDHMLRESLPVMHDLVGREMQTGDPKHEMFARMFDEFSTPATPDPLLDAMAVSGAGIRRASRMVTLRGKDMWSQTDPDLALLGNSLQKELHMEMDPAQREWVNGAANKAAAAQLRPVIPQLMSQPDLMREVDLDTLLGRGAPPDVVGEMRSKGIVRAAMIDAVRGLFRQTYSQQRNLHTDAVIDYWRKTGKLREEVEKQLTVENQLQGYRFKHSGKQR